MKDKKLLIIIIASVAALLIILGIVLGVVLSRPKTFEVTFDSDGGSKVESVMVKKGETLAQPTTPTRAGFNFDGWYLEDKKWNFETDKVEKDITLKAKWTEKVIVVPKVKYNVTFMVDGEILGEPQIVEDGVLLLAAPEKADYNFVGWYKESACINAWDFETDKVTKDISLYAKFAIKTFAVTFVVNDTTYDSATDIEINGLVTKPTDPNVEGYTFLGWYKESDCINAWNFETDKVTNNISLYAEFAVKTFEVRFVNDDNTLLKTEMVEYGKSAQAPENPTKTDGYNTCFYEFAGWNTDFSNVKSNLIVKAKFNELRKTISLDGCTYTLLDDMSGYVLSAKSSSGTVANDLVIPNVIGDFNKPVVAIEDNALSYTTNLTSVSIPKNIKTIGSIAFQYCRTLNSVTFEEGSSLTSLGDYVFSSCSALTSVEIPESVTSIGASTFFDCELLTNVVLPQKITSIPEKMFYRCSSLASIEIPESVTSIGESAFNTCIMLDNVVLPNSVTNIGDFAFQSCSALTSIILPQGITSIGNYTFKYCRALTSVTFAEDSALESISESAFSNCSALIEIALPDSVTSIESQAFEYCSNLVDIELSNNIKNIGSNAFYNCSNIKYYEDGDLQYLGNSENNYLVLMKVKDKTMTSYQIQDSTRIININVFRDCKALTNIVIPDNIINISLSAFYGCSALTSIEISKNVEIIGESAFYNCFKLESVTFEEGSVLNTIGKSAFENCEALTSIVIPKTVEIIKDYAFNSCMWLESVTFEEGINLTSIGKYAFSNCKRLTEIIIPKSVEIIDDYAFRGANLTNVIFEEGSKLTSIGIGAFSGSYIRSIVIPKSVEIICNGAFVDCPLESITFEEDSSLISIEGRAFSNCNKLTEIIIPISVTTMGENVFEKCALLTIKCEIDKIPDGFKSGWNSGRPYELNYQK